MTVRIAPAAIAILAIGSFIGLPATAASATTTPPSSSPAESTPPSQSPDSSDGPSESTPPSASPSASPTGSPPDATSGPEELRVSTPTIELQDFVRTPGEQDAGVEYTVTGLGGNEYDIWFVGSTGQYRKLEHLESPPSDGEYTGRAFMPGTESDETTAEELRGTYTIRVRPAGGDVVATGTFTVVPNGQGGEPRDDPDEDAPLTLAIAPERLSAADFVDTSKGVTLDVTGLYPGQTVTATVTPRMHGVETFDIVRTAGDDGSARLLVYGTNASTPSVYVGDFDVRVSTSTQGEGASGRFTVFAASGSGAGNGAGDAGARDLPRTGGVGLAGLAMGGSLLVLGAGSIFLSRRLATGSTDT